MRSIPRRHTGLRENGLGGSRWALVVSYVTLSKYIGVSSRTTVEFWRTCLAARQVSRVPVDKRHVSSGIHANHTTGHARLLLEFLEFKKGVPEFNLFLDGLLRSYEKTH